MTETLKKTFRTPYSIEKEKKDADITAEYNRMMQAPDAMSTAVESFIMKKYKINSRGTVHKIRARTAKREKLKV